MTFITVIVINLVVKIWSENYIKVISNSHINIVSWYNPRGCDEETQLHKQMRYGVTGTSVKAEWKVLLHHLKKLDTYIYNTWRLMRESSRRVPCGQCMTMQLMTKMTCLLLALICGVSAASMSKMSFSCWTPAKLHITWKIQTNFVSLECWRHEKQSSLLY